MNITRWDRVQAWGLYTYYRWVWHTARYQAVGQEHIAQARTTGRPLIFAAWHGMTMMFSGYLFVVEKEEPGRYVCIVPDDHRGAVLQTFAERLGGFPFTISMQAESMVAARRLLELIRHLENGKNLAVNPDGPDGPTHEPKGGVTFIARKSHALLIPMGAYTDRCVHLRRWDQYTIPFPYSRIAIAIGEPMEVAQEDDLEAARVELKDRLNVVERVAEELYQSH